MDIICAYKCLHMGDRLESVKGADGPLLAVMHSYA